LLPRCWVDVSLSHACEKWCLIRDQANHEPIVISDRRAVPPDKSMEVPQEE